MEQLFWFACGVVVGFASGIVAGFAIGYGRLIFYYLKHGAGG